MKSAYSFKFEELKMYHKAMDYGDFVNEQIKGFPKEEKYRLGSQFIRAADSIALNIAEGSSSSYTKRIFFTPLISGIIPRDNLLHPESFGIRLSRRYGSRFGIMPTLTDTCRWPGIVLSNVWYVRLKHTVATLFLQTQTKRTVTP